MNLGGYEESREVWLSGTIVLYVDMGASSVWGEGKARGAENGMSAQNPALWTS